MAPSQSTGLFIGRDCGEGRDPECNVPYYDYSGMRLRQDLDSDGEIAPSASRTRINSNVVRDVIRETFD
jgi:hypothetical protein